MGENADLVRGSDGFWTINDKYNARKDAINLLLETINRIDIISPVSKNEFDNVVRRLASKGVKVEIYNDANGDPTKTYYVGDATANHHGTYMLLEKNGRKSTMPFITYVPGFIGYLSTRFFSDENLWRDRTIFAEQVDNIQKLELVYATDSAKSFVIENGSEGFIAKDILGNVISRDDLALRDYLRSYKSVHYEYVEVDLGDEVRDSVLSTTPQHVFRLLDNEGNTRKLKTYLKPLREVTYDINTGEELTHNLDRCVGLIDGVDFVTIQYFILDDLLITSDDIRRAVPVDK